MNSSVVFFFGIPGKYIGVNFLYKNNKFHKNGIFALDHTGNEATVLHYRVNPHNWQSFERVTAFLFFAIFAKEIQRLYDTGPVCPRSTRKG